MIWRESRREKLTLRIFGGLSVSLPLLQSTLLVRSYLERYQSPPQASAQLERDVSQVALEGAVLELRNTHLLLFLNPFLTIFDESFDFVGIGDDNELLWARSSARLVLELVALGENQFVFVFQFFEGFIGGFEISNNEELCRCALISSLHTGSRELYRLAMLPSPSIRCGYTKSQISKFRGLSMD